MCHDVSVTVSITFKKRWSTYCYNLCRPWSLLPQTCPVLHLVGAHWARYTFVTSNVLRNIVSVWGAVVFCARCQHTSWIKYTNIIYITKVAIVPAPNSIVFSNSTNSIHNENSTGEGIQTNEQIQSDFYACKMECVRLKIEKKALKIKLATRDAQTSLLDQQVTDLTSETKTLRKQIPTGGICRMCDKMRCIWWKVRYSGNLRNGVPY